MKLQVGNITVTGQGACGIVYAYGQDNIDQLLTLAGKEVAFPTPETTAQAQAREAQREQIRRSHGTRR